MEPATSTVELECIDLDLFEGEARLWPQAFAADEATTMAGYLGSLLLDDGQSVQPGSLDRDLLRRIAAMGRDRQVLRLRIYSPSGIVVYSTAEDEVGTVNQNPYFQEILRSRRTVTVEIDRDDASLEGQRMGADLVEIYVPVIRQGRLAGVFELYYDITDPMRGLRRIVNISLAVQFSMAAVLLVAVLLSVARASGYLADREREHKDNLIGEGISSNFTYDRNRLLDAIGEKAEQVVRGYDKHAEAAAIAENAMNAVAASAAVEVGAIGLGTIVTILATTMAADVTGIVAAGAIAALGFFIIPAKRRAAKTELHAKLASLRKNLVDSLMEEFGKEIDHSQKRIEEAIAPYTRFIRSETAHTEKLQQELKAALLEVDRVRAMINAW